MGLFETLLGLLLSLFTVWWGGEVNPLPLTATTTAEVVEVIDGDTIVVRQENATFKVRYIGIDTPEPYAKGDPECGSHEATEANKQLVVGKQVELVPDQEDQDKYGRSLRYVYVDGIFVNEKLIRDGLAKPLSIKPNTRFADTFRQEANEAKQAKIGNWGVCSK